MIGSWPSNRIRAVAKDLVHVSGEEEDVGGSIDRRSMPDWDVARGARCLRTRLRSPFYSSRHSFVCRNGLTNDVSAVTTGACAAWIRNEAGRSVAPGRSAPAPAHHEPARLCPLHFYPCTEWIIDADVSRTMANSSARHICHHLWNLATRSSSEPRDQVSIDDRRTFLSFRKSTTGRHLDDELINYVRMGSTSAS